MPETKHTTKKTAESKAQPRVLTGTVVSDSTDKTISVQVVNVKIHPKYKKRYRVSKKYLAHDESNTYKVGDTVTITEHPPFSKRKRWITTAINSNE